VPEWLHGEFLALGYSAAETRYQEFTLPGGQRQRNVLCGPGQDHPGFVLLCAHYDSLSETPDTLAPGADDNASGVAVLLEAAALLREAPLRRGILYAAFGGEEQGLFGSAGCAEVAAGEGWRIDVVVNLDMVAYQSAAKPGHIVVEYDQGNRHPGNDAAAKAYGLLMAQAAADYSTLTVEHTDIWNSDYMPFEARGYPCIGVFEASENPGYHMTADVASVLDTNHLAEVARMVVATLCLIAR
jgi:Zn-dependent M28 family amino/carboxypeptidase